MSAYRVSPNCWEPQRRNPLAVKSVRPDVVAQINNLYHRRKWQTATLAQQYVHQIVSGGPPVDAPEAKVFFNIDSQRVRGFNNGTILHLAALHGDIEVTSDLLAAAPDAESRRRMILLVDGSGMTAVHHAASNGHVGVLDALIPPLQAKVPGLQPIGTKDLYSTTGWSPLHCAAHSGSRAALLVLLDSLVGDDSEQCRKELIRKSKSGYNCLDAAVSGHCWEMVEMISNLTGIDLDAVPYSERPFSLALLYDAEEVVGNLMLRRAAAAGRSLEEERVNLQQCVCRGEVRCWPYGEVAKLLRLGGKWEHFPFGPSEQTAFRIPETLALTALFPEGWESGFAAESSEQIDFDWGSVDEGVADGLRRTVRLKVAASRMSFVEVLAGRSDVLYHEDLLLFVLRFAEPGALSDSVIRQLCNASPKRNYLIGRMSAANMAREKLLNLLSYFPLLINSPEPCTRLGILVAPSVEEAHRWINKNYSSRGEPKLPMLIWYAHHYESNSASFSNQVGAFLHLGADPNLCGIGRFWGRNPRTALQLMLGSFFDMSVEIDKLLDAGASLHVDHSSETWRQDNVLLPSWRGDFDKVRHLLQVDAARQLSEIVV